MSLADMSAYPIRTSLPRASVRAILGRMLGWLVLVILGSLVVVAALVGSGVLRVRRYSLAHVEGRLAVAGRGLFFSRTPTACAGGCGCALADGCWRTETAGALRR